MAGQGTIALESFMDEPHFDLVLVPTGGGGLISGVAMVAKQLNPGIKVIGLQTEASDPWLHSFRARRVVEVEYGETLADGLLGEVGAANLHDEEVVDAAQHHVEESLRALEEVTQRLTRRASGLTLKIPTCAMRWMLPKIMGLRSVEADVDIQLTTTLSHSVDFDSEPFDAAVVYGERAARGYAQRGALFAEVRTPVCAPALAKRLRSPADLDKHTLLHPTRDHADWRRWLDAAGATKVRSDLGQNFETMDLAVDAAVHGFGVAIGDRLLSDEEVAVGRLVRPFELAVATGEHYFLVVPERSLRSTKVMRFRDWLLEQHPIPTPTPEHSR